jgi:hypothetical protein
MYKTVFKFSLLVFSALFLSACSEDYIQPKFIESTNEYDEYLVHYEYKKEQWNDPEILSTPRLQFSWEAPDGKHKDGYNLNTIWSMRLDGTDLREVVSRELLDTPNIGGTVGKVQFELSQNILYLAFSVSSSHGVERRIIDLETQTVEVIEISYGDPDFNWFGDSRYLLFGGREGLQQYDLQTKKITLMGDKFKGVKNISEYFSYDNGNQIIVSDVNDFVGLYDFESKKLLKKLNGVGEKMAADSRFWVDKEDIGRRSRTYISELENAEVPIGFFPNRISSRYSVSVKDRVYTTGGRGLLWAKPGDEKVTYYILPGERKLQNLSITNAYADFNE